MKDIMSWYKASEKRKCEVCGKFHRHMKQYTHYFDTMDGGDYISFEQCWVCETKTFISHYYRTVKSKIKPMSKEARKIWKKYRKTWSKYDTPEELKTKKQQIKIMFAKD
jgi:hypothetical protein